MSNGVVHTLDKVAYVPKFRRNLISVSQLDSEGYGCKAHGGVMKVTKGSIVLIKGGLRHGLYRLDGYALKTSLDSRKWKSCARVSFAEEATKVDCFQAEDGRKCKIPAGLKVESKRFLSGVK
ncbi:hypothetical protein RND81_09G003800 [Saponaria officinalis]|uniref:FAS1 domain-containing protein n=1 Tax=Saponaria officinalis TaxID=3572 RepID=A0AAW1IH26_SAPOF